MTTIVAHCPPDVHFDHRALIAEAEVAVQPSDCPAGMFPASQAAWPRLGGVRLRGSGEGPASLTTCTPEGAPVTWCAGLALVGALSGARLGLPAGMAAVQQESTATGADAGGLAGTLEDGDLHG